MESLAITCNTSFMEEESLLRSSLTTTLSFLCLLRPGSDQLRSAQTRFTSVEREELLYPSSTMVAEVGGTLGLFLGVSFMTIWNGAISVKEYINIFKSRLLESHFKE